MKYYGLAALVWIGGIVLNIALSIFVEAFSVWGGIVGGVIGAGVISAILIKQQLTRVKASHADHAVCLTNSKITRSVTTQTRERMVSSGSGGASGAVGNHLTNAATGAIANKLSERGKD